MDYSKGEIFKSQAVYDDKKLRNALTVHSFKEPSMMHRIHQFYLEIAVSDSEKSTARMRKELAEQRKVTGKNKAFP